MESLLPELLSTLHPDLNEAQTRALKILESGENVFLTGGAGTGKSYLLRKFLKGTQEVKLPILASTGGAAVLINGRTFHSFFGLGIFEGGAEATIERALADRRVVRRIKKAVGFVLDEISMIPGVVLESAERIARAARGDERPWGGLRVIAVGDFAQLPPVTRDSRKRDWAFQNSVWEKSNFVSVELNEIMRSKGDAEFNEFLSDVRLGIVSPKVREMLDRRATVDVEDIRDSAVLHARKVDVERINLQRLAELPGESKIFLTEYSGENRMQRAIAAHAPIPEKLELKKGALVMLRQNDPRGRWVNGSMGHVEGFSDSEIEVKLLSGNFANLEKSRFSLLNAEGGEVAAAKNFPLTLAYAITIHKAQGTTLDQMRVSLRDLWEPGQAYVALSRVRSSRGLWVDDWNESSIFADPEVLRFQMALADSR